MSNKTRTLSERREFVRRTGQIAVGGLIAGGVLANAALCRAGICKDATGY